MAEESIKQKTLHDETGRVFKNHQRGFIDFYIL